MSALSLNRIKGFHLTSHVDFDSAVVPARMARTRAVCALPLWRFWVGGSPFTRSIFKIKGLSERLRELNAHLNELGVTSGVTNAQIASCARESKTRSQPIDGGGILAIRVRGSQVRVLVRYLPKEQAQASQEIPFGSMGRKFGGGGAPRSGRGGRRFKSCHSDYELADS